MDFQYTPEQQAFRREVRGWLAASVPMGMTEGLRLLQGQLALLLTALVVPGAIAIA